MSQFAGQDQWGNWTPTPNGGDPCLYPMHPDCLATQNNQTMNDTTTEQPVITPLRIGISMIAMALAIYLILKYGKGKGFWYGFAIWIGVNVGVNGVGYLVDSAVNRKP